MELEFVNRELERRDFFRLIRTRPSGPPVIVLDSPAGMGKTRLVFEVCRDLVRDAYRRQVEWRIVRLDFRKHFPNQFSNEKDIVEEIARQLCRDTQWDNICDLIRQADPDDQVLIQEAAFIPMENEVRQALLDLVADISKDVLTQIGHIIAQVFKDADIQEARQNGSLLSVSGLIDFILGKYYQKERRSIPDHVLLVLDGVDAIAPNELRLWVVNDLARGLGVHGGLQNTIERFAVIVSGRFIEQDIDPQKEQSFLTIPLRSFTDKSVYVADLIRQFGDETFNVQNYLDRLARKLCQVCGGHPRVIKETAVELYGNPGHFATLEMDPGNETAYWYARDKFRKPLRQYRDTAISEIMESVGEQEQCLLRLLSIFRKFNATTLEFLSREIHERKLHRFYECFEGDIKVLYKNLLKTRLIGNDGARDLFDSDRFSLSLLSAQMEDEDPQMFRLLNEWAADMYENWIRGVFSAIPDAPRQLCQNYQETGICEWLFHQLRLAGRCSELAEARQLGERLSSELKGFLEHITPYPLEDKAAQRRRIRRYVEDDKQIDHLIWEKALENSTRYNTIRAEILQAFSE